MTSVQRLRAATNRLEAVLVQDAKRQRRDEIARQVELDSSDEETSCIRKEIWAKQISMARAKVQEAEEELDEAMASEGRGAPSASQAAEFLLSEHHAADQEMEEEVDQANAPLPVAQAIAAELARLAASPDVTSNFQVSEAIQALDISDDMKEHLVRSLWLNAQQLDKRPAAPAVDPVVESNTSNLSSSALGDLVELVEMGLVVAWPKGLDERIARLILRDRAS